MPLEQFLKNVYSNAPDNQSIFREQGGQFSEIDPGDRDVLSHIYSNYGEQAAKDFMTGNPQSGTYNQMGYNAMQASKPYMNDPAVSQWLSNKAGFLQGSDANRQRSEATDPGKFSMNALGYWGKALSPLLLAGGAAALAPSAGAGAAGLAAEGAGAAGAGAGAAGSAGAGSWGPAFMSQVAPGYIAGAGGGAIGSAATLAGEDAALGAGMSGMASGAPVTPAGLTSAFNAGYGADLAGAAAGGGISPGTQAALGQPGATGAPATPTGAPAGPGPISPSTAVSGAGTAASGAQAVAGQGGGSSDDFVNNILEQLKKNALGLGVAGASMALAANQQNKNTEGMPSAAQALNQSVQNTQPATQLGQQYLTAAQSGNLVAGQQAQVDQYVNEALNQVRQYFASIGQSDSTSAKQAEAKIQQTGVLLKSQMVQQNVTTGLNALGVGTGPLNQMAQYQSGQDQALIQAMGNFAQGAAGMFGQQAGKGTITQGGAKQSAPTQTQTAPASTAAPQTARQTNPNEDIYSFNP